MRKKSAKPIRARTAKPPTAPPTMGPIGTGSLLRGIIVVEEDGALVVLELEVEDERVVLWLDIEELVVLLDVPELVVCVMMTLMYVTAATVWSRRLV